MQRILLSSDALSPNAGPHGLPALLWPGLFRVKLLGGDSDSDGDGHAGGEGVRQHLRSVGWEPAWTFPMYKQAHYHSTTHELLSIVRGSASLLLGGSDADADDHAHVGAGAGADKRSSSTQSERATPAAVVIDVSVGDVLLLPAGYSHRALRDSDGFSMIGSYPAKHPHSWDMCYPDSSECSQRSQEISSLVQRIARKGLGEKAGDPARGIDGADQTGLATAWQMNSNL